MIQTARWLIPLLVTLVACTPDTVVPPEGRDADGNNQLVTYTRDRTGNHLGSMGVQVVSARSTTWSALGASGCESVDYPWSLSVGPRLANDEDYSTVLDAGDGYETMLDSGNVNEGTTIVWIDRLEQSADYLPGFAAAPMPEV